MADVSPSPSIIDRILGRTPSDPAFDARMNLAKQKMQQEMPNEMANTSIEPIGPIGRMGYGILNKVIGAAPVATTSRFGGITYDPTQAKDMNQNELEDTLAHELTHVKQIRDIPLWKRLSEAFLPSPDEGLPEESKKALRMSGWDPAYRGKSSEMEAYQTEDQRRMKRGDIMRPGEDIQLFSNRKKQSGIKTGPSKVSN